MNMNEILARLQNGETPDSIAKEYTDALNSALQKYNEEKEAEKALSNKIADTSTLLENLKDYADCYYKDFVKVLDEIDPTDLIELFDSLVELAEVAKELEKAGILTVKTCGDPNKCDCKKSVDPLSKFLKENGLSF